MMISRFVKRSVALSVMMALTTPVLADWTVEDPSNGTIGAVSDGSVGNRTREDFAADAGVTTFTMDVAQGGRTIVNVNNNPGRLVLTDYYASGDGVRIDIQGAGTSGFSQLLDAGGAFNTTTDTSIVTNRSRMTFDVRRRETSADRTVSAVGFTISSMADDLSYVQFFDATASVIIVDPGGATPDRIMIGNVADSVFVGFDAGSQIISSFEIVNVNTGIGETGEQFGVDDISISLGSITIPEPASLSMLAIGGMMMLRRRAHG